MTAFAFILGVVPLMKANGAGAGAQNVMGTAVFWGMLVATFLGVFIIPGNFTFIEGLGRRKKKEEDEFPEILEQPLSVVEDDGTEVYDTIPQVDIPVDGSSEKTVAGNGATKSKHDDIEDKTSAAAAGADKDKKP